MRPVDVFFNAPLMLALEDVPLPIPIPIHIHIPKPIPIKTSNKGPAGGRMSAVKMGFRKSKELMFMTVCMDPKVDEQIDCST
jgi:hypothetical protein